MIRRLLAWIFADLIQRLDASARQLAVLDARLIALQTHAGLSTAVPPPPSPREWGCGHTSISGVDYHDGRTDCLDCHQRALLERA